MTSAAFTSLATTSLEDTMEVSSSPAGNAFDNDIDIDFDDYGVHLTDDERMLEDGDPMRPPTATDEMMDDDEHATTLVEEVMQDDPPNDQAAQQELADEELIDYDDDSYQDIDQSFLDDTTLQNTETNFAIPAEVPSEPGQIGEVTSEPELFSEEQANLEEQNITPAGDVEASALDTTVQEDRSSESQTTAQATSEDTAQAVSAHESGDVGEEAAAVDSAAIDRGDDLLQDIEAATAEPIQGDDAIGMLKAPPQFPGALDTTSGFVPDGPPTPTDTGLPPMTINYHTYSMPMFKSKNQPDGLLKSDNFASLSLSSLMQECRRRLQGKVGEGETIPASHDIVLGFDGLRVVLFEVYHPFPPCTGAFTNSFIV